MSEEHSFWSALDAEAQRLIREAMTKRSVGRGEKLIARDAAADELFIVNSGLFEVRNNAGHVVVEIGPGQLMGEMGFFSGGARTADVYAARDSVVLEIHRAAFEKLTARVPDIQRAITRSLAQRLVGLAAIVRERQSIGPSFCNIHRMPTFFEHHAVYLLNNRLIFYQ